MDSKPEACLVACWVARWCWGLYLGLRWSVCIHLRVHTLTCLQSNVQDAGTSLHSDTWEVQARGLQVQSLLGFKLKANMGILVTLSENSSDWEEPWWRGWHCPCHAALVFSVRVRVLCACGALLLGDKVWSGERSGDTIRPVGNSRWSLNAVLWLFMFI